MIIRHFWYVLLLLLLMGWSTFAHPIKVGYRAPNFTLFDTNQEPVSLTDFYGKYVVLEWFNPHCRTVQQHRKTVRKLAHHYWWRGVIWLGINSTYYMTLEDNRMWKETNQLGYRLLRDFTGEIAYRYQVKMTPHFYIINPLGIVIYNGALDNNLYGDKVRPFNYVKAALEEALANRPVSYPQTDLYGCLVNYNS